MPAKTKNARRARPAASAKRTRRPKIAKAAKAAKIAKAAKAAPPAKATNAAKETAPQPVRPARPVHRSSAELHFTETAIIRGEAVEPGEALPSGATHEIAGHDASGQPVLKRKRFSIC